MLIEKQITHFHKLDQWFTSDHGLQVAAAFTAEIAKFKDKLNGEILLQLGNCGANPWLSCLRYQRKWLMSPYMDERTNLAASMHQFPLDRNSIDCILAPLTMSAFPLAKSPLDEIDRILKPMGHVIFIGINPLSLWGCWLRFAAKSCFGPLHACPPSVLSLKYAMLHRGYVQRYFSNFYYIPPVRSKESMQDLEILNVIAKMISPLPAGFYCLAVQKFQESNASPAPSQWDDGLVPFAR